mmetsp:Transcript_84/g.271  ORF Transcript_84/g.271 Transcript_84/m.271 type:complete len:243 (+) Transcript_84:78-806(+)
MALAAAGVAAAAVVLSLTAAAVLRSTRAAPLGARPRVSPPQAPDVALVLGGDAERERRAAALLAGDEQEAASASPASTLSPKGWAALPVVVSSGHGDAEEVFLAAGVHPSRLTVDHDAVDTVSNMTSASVRRALGLDRSGLYRHVAVVTSSYHARRARWVARAALGGRGHAYTAVALHGGAAHHGGGPGLEPWWRCARDAARAWAWAGAGLDLSVLGLLVHPERFTARRRRSRPAGGSQGST